MVGIVDIIARSSHCLAYSAVFMATYYNTWMLACLKHCSGHSVCLCVACVCVCVYVCCVCVCCVCVCVCVMRVCVCVLRVCVCVCVYVCVCVLPIYAADTDGMVKVLSDSKTDRILGIHIVGSVSYIHSLTTLIYKSSI